MIIFKYKYALLLSLFAIANITFAQQTTISYDVEWLGYNYTHRLPNGEKIIYPMATDAIVNLDGNLVLQKDVPGNITGNIRFESISYYAGDSISKLALKTVTVSEAAITYIRYNNKGVYTRIYIPLLKLNADGNWSQLASFTLGYTLSPERTSLEVENPYVKSYTNARTSNVTGSVLASGNWYKLGVSQTSIYKIDVAYLSNLGINTSNLNPDMIQIYGNGGGMLPQSNSESRLDDLVENAIFVSEDGNGIFDNNDYILFYGESPHAWNYNILKDTYTHEFNIYSNQNFYFLTVNQQIGKRIENQANLVSTAQTLTEYDERLFSETDLYNIMDSGREWYGFQFSSYNTNLNTPFNVTGITSGSNLSLTTSVVGRSYKATNMSVRINNNILPSGISLPVLSTVAHAELGKNVTDSFTFNSSLLGGSNTATIGLTFLNGNASAAANLNYLELLFSKSLRLYDNQTFFRSAKSLLQPTTSYVIENTTGIEKIWDISDPQNVTSQNYVFNNGYAEFGNNSTNLKEYVVLKGESFPYPGYIETVSNQNLHDITSSNMPDMIIVVAPEFLSQAQRLANFRQQNDGIRSFICTPKQIYNEFGCGKADITAIRDFVKMVYDRGTVGSQLKYLLLFGSCTYDYKNILGGGGNFVPTYESRESLREIESYNSDDYFGFLDNGDGYWKEEFSGNPLINMLSIGVGRLPVKSVYQADIVVNKLIFASKPSTAVNGNWENKMTLICDDGDNNHHLDDAENLYNAVVYTNNNKQININKIYLGAYPQESTPGGETASLVYQAINRDIEDGTLIWNYVGHGGNTGLAQEGIVTIPSINSWTNISKLGFYVTATCSFGRNDKPGLTSGAENILLSPNGGSFGNLTSTRTVYASYNATINLAFYKFAFLRNTDGTFYTLGEIIKRTKNFSVTGVYNRNYVFFGDPSMRIRYPQQNMVVTKINGVSINAVPDTLKALSKVTIEGLVQDQSGTTLSNFTGDAQITIFDKPSTIRTLGTDGSPITTFKLQSNIIFDGVATVLNGAYKVSFIVPKDISYQFDYGKISLYSTNSSGSIDAGGYLTNIVIGGSNSNAVEDKMPPKAKLYMNDPSFVSGGITRENPVFYAEVSDENGINVSTAGIGHEITLQLSTSSDVIILNKYYTAAKDDYTKGKIVYPLKDLPAGSYSLKFKVWDTYNNSTEQTLDFTIQNTEKIQLSHVLNYPNPFSTNTSFHFDHNRVGDNLMIQVQVFTVSGKLIKTLDETVYNSPSHVGSIHWDGLDDYGDKIGRGVYVYKLKIRSLQDGSTTHVYEKLVLLN